MKPAIALVFLLLGIALAVPLRASAANGDAEESALARTLIQERQTLEALKASPHASKDAVLAQERKLMETRAKLSGVLARELAKQSVDSDQWQNAWNGMKSFLRDKLRGWLDEPRAAPATPPGSTRA